MFSAISDFINRVLSVFSTFTIFDLLDILFVAFLIYISVRIIRETRAMQFLRAILVGVLIYAIVNILNMETSTYIFERIFQNIVLIIIVLFSPEIRNMLEQLGKGTAGRSIRNFFRPDLAAKRAEISDCIEAVTKACADMSDTKTGALIVWENQTMLGNIIDSGVLINAKASSALIENIFYPKTPLHDGALVIRDGMVYAAGCILPLTKKDVKSSFGTRHRAAIGMSEECDATIIVVSEETGVISVAKNGKIKTELSDGDLRATLTDTFLSDKAMNKNKKKNRSAKKVEK